MRRMFCWLMVCTIAQICETQEFAQQELRPILEQSVIVHNRLDNLVKYKSYKCSFSETFFFGVIPYVVLVIDICKAIKAYRVKKKQLQSMSYQNFVVKYAHLIPFVKKITSIQNWLHMSQHGTLPQQIMARIHLAQVSLCQPYDKVMNQCAQKLLKTSFDEQGRFVWRSFDPACKAYKKFYKKVPQTYQDVIKSLQDISRDFQISYKSIVADRVNNEYNQMLLDIIYAEIEQNYPRLKQLCRKGYDCVVDTLYDYYETQNKIQQDSEIQDVLLSDILVLALHYSSSEYDDMIQQIADTLLKIIVMSYEYQTDEFDKQMNQLHELLLDQISNQ